MLWSFFHLANIFVSSPEEIFDFIAKFSQIQLSSCFESQSNPYRSSLHPPSYRTENAWKYLHPYTSNLSLLPAEAIRGSCSADIGYHLI